THDGLTPSSASPIEYARPSDRHPWASNADRRFQLHPRKETAMNNQGDRFTVRRLLLVVCAAALSAVRCTGEILEPVTAPRHAESSQKLDGVQLEFNPATTGRISLDGSTLTVIWTLVNSGTVASPAAT